MNKETCIKILKEKYAYIKDKHGAENEFAQALLKAIGELTAEIPIERNLNDEKISNNMC